jgi:hypothetical protein
MRRRGGRAAAMILIAALAGCKGKEAANESAARQASEPKTIDVPQTVSAMAPGTTPMAERVAVIGLLNKRNGVKRELTLKPGQTVRVGDAIVRLRACETTAPWEVQKLTGAFVQLDVRNPQDRWQRVFSGWLYKETPSLNVVEHRVYDVWPKSCAMTHPDAAGSAVRDESAASNRSSAANSAPAVDRSPTNVPSRPSGAPKESADSNSIR